jgi:Protein of unknown function (DUF2608)
MKFLSFLVICFFCVQINGYTISMIQSFNEFDFSNLDSDTLVLFDVDETLIQPVDNYKINQWTEPAKELLLRLVEQYASANWDHIHAILFEKVEYLLTEPHIIKIIQELQAKKVPVIALTAMRTGQLGPIVKEEWRYHHLKSLGFEGNWSEHIIPFEPLDGKPIFYKGILCTDMTQKGPVLGAFLDTIQWYPKKVIFFDDLKHYVESVADECQKRGFIFEGYVYLGALEKEWNHQLVEFQLTHLINYYEWINDEMALQILTSPSEPKSSIN